MWIVASRERPHLLSRFLRAFHDTGAESRLMVVVDETDPQIDAYKALGCPLMVYPGETVGCAKKYQYAYERRPHEPFYGILVDDCEPKTKGWDRALINAAGPHWIAYPNDELRMPGYGALCCIGSNLVKCVGFLALPVIEHYGIDNFWWHLGKRTGRQVYLPGVTVALTGNMPGEPWDHVKAKQKSRQHEDTANWEAYKAGPDFAALVDRLKC